MKENTIIVNEKNPNEGELLLSFARGLYVLEAFSQNTSTQSMADLARTTELPRATVRRILLTLVNLGYAIETDKQYQLTPKILTLAHSYLTSNNLPRLVQPILEELTKATGEASSFAILDQENIIYIARSSEEKMRIMSSSLHVGSTLPAYCTSMGRAILSQMSREKQKKILLSSSIESHTEHTITEIPALLDQLEIDKKNGFSLVNQELEIGLCSIAIPIKDNSQSVIGAINISTHILRNRPENLKKEYLNLLKSQARKIAFNLALTNRSS